MTMLGPRSTPLPRETQPYAPSRLRTEQLKKVFADWIDSLLDPDEAARKTAHDMLVAAGDRAVDVMIDGLSSRSPQLQWRILPILGEIGSEKALRAVAVCLHAENSAIVAAAAQVLGRSGSAFAGDLALLHIQSMRAEIEAGSIWIIAALGQLHEARAIPSLIDILHGTQNPTVRYTTIEALGKIGDRRVLPEIYRYANDPSHHVRDKVEAAIEALTHG